MLSKEKYLSHIRDEDRKIEMRKLLDKVDSVLKNHYVLSTDFLDPYSVRLAKAILNSFVDIKYLVTGASLKSERSIIYIYPDYMDFEDISLDLQALKISGRTEKISHRDFLGAILGLGIVREKIGDILIYDDYGIVILKAEIKDYVKYNLDKIGRQNVEIEEISLEQIRPIEDKYREIRATVSSLRLDLFISKAYNLSRQESDSLIKSSRVKVNWEPMEKASRELEEGDVVSVKGYGRSYLHSIEGISKKGKTILIIRILI